MQAALLELKTVVVIRNYDWGFPRISAVAAMEWSLESSMQIIGPTLAWCQRWANKTTTCGIQNGNCRCGTQSEFDNMGYKYNVADMPSFYEVSEALVVEPGFDTRGPGISPALVEFVEGIIQAQRCTAVLSNAESQTFFVHSLRCSGCSLSRRGS